MPSAIWAHSVLLITVALTVCILNMPMLIVRVILVNCLLRTLMILWAAKITVVEVVSAKMRCWTSM